jgi:hypothetical protein
MSVAISDMIQVAREWEGRKALADWLSESREGPNEETVKVIRADRRRARRTQRRTSAR